ncbi:MAG: glycoside hydrolase family 2 [Erysipelotrichaceae bacterium]|nr:glycoside hydrolase family 2 [Erysipelotrichaceae bacterium]
MKLKTPYSNTIDRSCPLSEYPRPQFVRDSFFCLNGSWQYSILDGNGGSLEEGEILVPFPAGSPLSGVEHILQPQEILFYKKEFTFTKTKKRALLHFEAVDQIAEVTLNGKRLGSHSGGYTAFAFEIGDLLEENNLLEVRVRDYTNTGDCLYGKQALKHGGIFYTPTAGIWQSVWIEELSEEAVEEIKIIPLFDKEKVALRLKGNFHNVHVKVLAEGKTVTEIASAEKDFSISLPGFRPWTTEDPFLYDLIINTGEDEVRSYFGMRCFTKERDRSGLERFCLNHKPVFLSGLLDQGYISESIYTFPCEKALTDELEAIKEMGFNFLRKHVKVECRRWYYHCDRLGILVFQDIPNGGSTYSKLLTMVEGTLGIAHKDDQYKRFARESLSGQEQYYREAEEILKQLHDCVSLCGWVPFNEGWGQFDAVKVTEFFRQKDPYRLIDSTSGWFDQNTGDFLSKHIYFRPYAFRPDKGGRIVLLSEFGGYAFVDKEHVESAHPGGYKNYKDQEAYMAGLEKLYERDVRAHIPKGLCGAIYTQVSDVEDECNGLFTYDRAVCKVDKQRMKKINLALYQSLG